jgi:uncharacterized membrane protein
MIYQLFILIASILGFGLARYIYLHKAEKKALVCPLKASCEPVIYSKYSVFLGLDLAIWGMLYYIVIFLSYFLYLTFNLDFDLFKFLIFSLSFLAFLFSIYLIFIQAVKLKQFCSWCLASAFFSIVIFISSFIIYRESLIILAQEFQTLSIFIHAFAAGLGLGVIIVVDYLFFRFLRDKRIDEREKEVLENLSDFLWILIGLIFISGVFIYFSDIEKYHVSTKFMVKMFIFSVITINGLLLNTFIAPKLSEIHFEKFDRKSFLAFSMGIISLVSWFLAFLLGRLKYISFTFLEGVLIYFLLVFISLLLGNLIIRKKQFLAKE